MEASTAKLAPYLERTASGDRSAFAELYQATSPKLYGIIRRIIAQKELADDVLQEAYLKVWQQAHRYDRERASPIAWMAVIARNCAIDEVRKRVLPVAADDALESTVADDQLNPVRQATTSEQLRKLTVCLEGLDPDRQDAIRLAYLDGYTRTELADRFSQPVGSIKSWLHRGLKHLRECLDA